MRSGSSAILCPAARQPEGPDPRAWPLTLPRTSPGVGVHDLPRGALCLLPLGFTKSSLSGAVPPIPTTPPPPCGLVPPPPPPTRKASQNSSQSTSRPDNGHVLGHQLHYTAAYHCFGSTPTWGQQIWATTLGNLLGGQALQKGASHPDPLWNVPSAIQEGVVQL